MKTKKKKLPNF